MTLFVSKINWFSLELINVFCFHFLPGEYAVRFIPRENGPHLVYVSFDGCQIRDSPFRVQVGSVHADPGMVQAYGDGLRIGKTGKDGLLF